MKDKLKNLSRRDVIKILSLGSVATVLVACAPSLSKTLTDTPGLEEPQKPRDSEGFITFSHELEGFGITINEKEFINISRKYGIPDTNFQDFDITLSKKVVEIGSNLIEADPVWVNCKIDNNNHGQIDIAFGTIINEYVKQFGIAANNQAQIAFLSTFASHASFVGYVQLGVHRNLFDKEWADQVAQMYLVNVLNLKDKLFIGVFPEPNLPKQDPIQILPLNIENS